jgi:hypothetical protein
MARASNIQKAERLILARALLRQHEHWPEAAQQLARRCSISERQAYRPIPWAQGGCQSPDALFSIHFVSMRYAAVERC